jgi:hypothetical protein
MRDRGQDVLVPDDVSGAEALLMVAAVRALAKAELARQRAALVPDRRATDLCLDVLLASGSPGCGEPAP